MKTYEVIATVDEHGNLIIPAPTSKAGARLRLVVNWEEEHTRNLHTVQSRKEAIRKLRGSLKNYPVMSVETWNKHKAQIW